MAAAMGKRKRIIYRKLITFVKDRPGHDRRYAINCDKIKMNWDGGRALISIRGLKKPSSGILITKSGWAMCEAVIIAGG